MDKRIGNAFLIVLLLLGTVSVYAGVTLRVTDMQGYELEQVGAGQPFNIEVLVSDLGSNLSTPSIRGDSGITLQNRGQQFSTINGKTTAKFTYQAGINEPGVYVLGPATVAHGEQSSDSNIMQLTVGTAQKTIGKQAKKDSEEVLFELSVDKNRLFVGESAQVTLTFYYIDDTICRNS